MLKKFIGYIMQSVAGMIGISIYVLADTFFISVQSGTDGLAVLNLILPVYGVMYAIGAMIGIGSATRYRLNRAKGEASDRYFGQSLEWNLLFSVPFMLCGLLAAKPLMELIGADERLTALGIPYLRIVLSGAPFFMCNYTFTAFARNDHAPAVAMWASIAGSMFNIVFDYVLMFPMGMGFAGAALATALSPVVTMAVCSVHFRSRRSQVTVRFTKLSASGLVSCCKLGISAFVGEISSAVITIVFNMLILGLAGNVGVAAYGVAANISMVGMCIFNGLAQGTQPMISDCYGKGQQDMVKKLLTGALAICGALELLMVAAIWLWTDGMVGIFNTEQDLKLLAYAHTGLRLYGLGFLAAGINILLAAYFSAVDHARPAIVGSVLRGAVAITICAIVLSRIFGLNGVWLSFLCSEVITLAVIGVLAKLEKQKVPEKRNGITE